ncbi:MAG: hypothetical protein PVJ57_05270 [Phycisphaerae bacterium]|jgi:hypothetical protein
MRHWLAGTLTALIVLAAPALGQPIVNGEAGVEYGYIDIVHQDTMTGFGDNTDPRPDWANGSELDAAYAVIDDGVLYIVFAGNFETNGNRLDIFFDTRAGGQNQILATNPDVDYGALQRMGYLDAENPGLKFDADFAADFFITANAFGDPTAVNVSYAELYIDEENPGVTYYMGHGAARCQTEGGALADADPAAPFAFLATVDNSNLDGVAGGYGVDNGSGVYTGLELAIPLAALGNPAGDFKVCAFINSADRNTMSNQVLAGLFGLVDHNLGEPRLVDFTTIAFNQYFTIPLVSPPYGACCMGEVCLETIEADCAGDWYENTSCDGNPCDTIPQGACCLPYECSVMTAADCAGAGGEYLGDGTNCDYCPCEPYGACCIDEETCVETTQLDCTENLLGSWVGDYTYCGEDTCTPGACCIEYECYVYTSFECSALGGRFLGAGTTCDGDPCSLTIEPPYVAGTMNGWDASANPMTETEPGSHIWTITFTGLTPDNLEEFKITDGTWDRSFPDGYEHNSWCYTDALGAITITYNCNWVEDGWSPSVARLGTSTDPATWTAAGDFQSEVGGSDWTNNDPVTQMLPTGDPGIYKYSVTGLPEGTWLWKAVVTGSWYSISWDVRSNNTANMEFTTTGPSDVVNLYVDSFTGTVMVETLGGDQVYSGSMDGMGGFTPGPNNNGWEDEFGNRWFLYDGPWWNTWWYNGAVEQNTKCVEMEFDITIDQPGGFAIVAVNWSTPDWTNPDRPPLPGDDVFVDRKTVGTYTESGHYVVYTYITPQPMWHSVDVWGENFTIDGRIVTVCLLKGDVNGDEIVNNFDIAPFVFAILHTQQEFEDAYPAGNYAAADTNCDGIVNNFDISPFVYLLTQ